MDQRRRHWNIESCKTCRPLRQIFLKIRRAIAIRVHAGIGTGDTEVFGFPVVGKPVAVGIDQLGQVRALTDEAARPGQIVHHDRVVGHRHIYDHRLAWWLRVDSRFFWTGSTL